MSSGRFASFLVPRGARMTQPLVAVTSRSTRPLGQYFLALLCAYAHSLTPRAMPADELFQSVKDGNTARSKAVHAAGTDVNTKDAFGPTALHHAAKEGSAEAVETRLAAGANVE